MTRVLLVGYEPETVDFSNAALPPSMSVEKIRAGVALALKQMTDRGWEGDVCYIRPDGTAGQMVARHLASAKYDCIVIGAGVRLPPQRLADLEAVVDAVRPLRTPPLLLIRGLKTAPMLPHDGCPLVESKGHEPQRPSCSRAEMRSVGLP